MTTGQCYEKIRERKNHLDLQEHDVDYIIRASLLQPA